VEFTSNDIDVALQSTEQDLTEQSKRPKDIDPPIISKLTVDTQPFMWSRVRRPQPRELMIREE